MTLNNKIFICIFVMIGALLVGQIRRHSILCDNSFSALESLLEDANNYNNFINPSSTRVIRPNEHKDQQQSVVLDILSTGSFSRPEYLRAQQETFGQHSSVRNFVTVTEQDDMEMDCRTNLTKEDALAIAERCRDKNISSNETVYPFLADISDLYIKKSALSIKPAPQGWICAQKRPMAGIQKYFRKYLNLSESHNQQHLSTTPMKPLPDYLLIIDDDTFVRVDQVLETLRRQEQEQEQDYITEADGINVTKNSSNILLPTAVTGCLLKSRSKNFSISAGGFGTILNKVALQRLSTPVFCKNTEKKYGNGMDDVTISAICANLQANLIGEGLLFREGMSILNLMDTYTHDQPYTKHKSWNDAGFCLASDTNLAYFLNRYVLVSTDTTNEGNDALATNYIQPYMGSTIYLGKGPKHPVSLANRRQCYNVRNRKCRFLQSKQAPGHICHYISDDYMHKLYQEDQDKKKD